MIWSCFSFRSVGYCCRLNGGVNSEMYVKVLEDEFFQSISCYVDEEKEWWFQQDNASCHKSKYTQKWFADNHIKLLEWPPQSPDMNPIECLELR